MNDIETRLRDSAARLAGAPADDLLVERAAAEGLLDVAYATADSPLGPLLVATTPRGLVRLAYQNEGLDEVLAELSRHVSPRVMEAPSRLDAVRRVYTPTEGKVAPSRQISKIDGHRASITFRLMWVYLA